MSSKNIFKGLALDRDMLYQWLTEFAEENFSDFTVNPIVHISGNQYRGIIKGDGKDITIDFYYNSDGKTTINPRVGQHQEISLRIASIILTKLQYKESDIQSRSYSVHPIEREDVDVVVEYLQELEGVELVGKSRNDTNKYWLFQYKSKIGDKITLKYFDKKRLQIQGKPMYLYQEVACLLSAYFPFDEIVKKQAEYFSVDINPTEIRIEMQQLIPNAYTALDEQLRKILSSSLSLRKVDIPLEDYSGFVFPALRTLEGYLKFLFSQKGILITKKDMFGNYLHQRPTGFVLNADAKARITCDKTTSAIEKCYTYYNTHRHGLFHTEVVASSTRILQTKQSAESIINDVLELIETTYSDIIGTFAS